MKKKNSYLADDEIDLGDIVKSLRKEKILVLSISIICGLLGYFYELSKPDFKTVILLKNPPIQIFEPYNLFNNNNPNNIAEQFISDFKLNLLSLDNVQNFIEESREFDKFKGYFKSKNISVGEVEEKNIIIPNKYFLNHPKEFDGAIFLNKYVEFIKKKTIVEFKNNLILTFQNTIYNHQEALEIAKKIQLENPIIRTPSASQLIIVNEPHALFYKGTNVLTASIVDFNNKMIKLENDQLNYNIIYQQPITHPNNPISLFLYFALGLMLGTFLSLIIIYLKIYQNKSN